MIASEEARIRVVKDFSQIAPLAVLGGMGTRAGISAFNNLTNAVEALMREEGLEIKDQTYPRMALVSASNIPDRTAYLLKHDVANLSLEDKVRVLTADVPDNPFRPLLAEHIALAQNGFKDQMVACNTEHAWRPVLQQALADRGYGDVNITSIIEQALLAAANKPAVKAKIDAGQTVRFGLMATDGTGQTRLYHSNLEALRQKDPRFKNVELVVPDEAPQKMIMDGIYDPKVGVKTGHAEESRPYFAAGADHLIEEKGADVLLQACTEIPEGMPKDDYKGTPLVDPNNEGPKGMARAAFERRQRENSEAQE